MTNKLRLQRIGIKRPYPCFGDISSKMNVPRIVREPAILLIKWLRPKGLKVCSNVEKYYEFKNQTLKKISWYTKMLCAAEYPGGRQFLKLALTLKWGTLYYRILFDLPCTPLTNFHRCQKKSWAPLNEKRMFLNINSFGLCENKWLPWKTCCAILTCRGVHTNSIIS